MSENRILVFIPTYNESGNAGLMCQRLLALGIPCDILFLDDNSPDGTGQVLDELAAAHPQVSVIHRSGKLGIGTAHKQGIQFAYDGGYEVLVTLDCDFTHTPEDIVHFLEKLKGADIVVGNRYQDPESLKDWSRWRRLITHMAHWLTGSLLGLPQDATGAFRAYDLRKVPQGIFKMVESGGYAFFFESLFRLHVNGVRIVEVPIRLPARFLGSSKLSMKEALRGVLQLVKLSASNVANRSRFRYVREQADISSDLVDPQDWDTYWKSKDGAPNVVYEVLAGLYRTLIIKRNLNSVMLRTFRNGARVLHAGCGSGQVDVRLQKYLRITAVDISPAAVKLYERTVRRAHEVRHASIFALPYGDSSFDGVYNLGVMEHFHEPEIQQILLEFHRVIAPGGKLVLFWPHKCGTSVAVLKAARWVFKNVLHKEVQFHPDEVTYTRGAAHMKGLLAAAGFDLVEYNFGPSDGFVQAAIVARRQDDFVPAQAPSSDPN